MQVLSGIYLGTLRRFAGDGSPEREHTLLPEKPLWGGEALLLLDVIYNSQREGIKKLINLGSSCIYPANQEKPLAEEMILTGLLEPANEGYALAKVVCAKMCSYISKDYPGFWYKTIVPCNLYGKYDKFTVDGAHMIPAAIHKVYRAKAAAKECVSI